MFILIDLFSPHMHICNLNNSMERSVNSFRMVTLLSPLSQLAFHPCGQNRVSPLAEHTLHGFTWALKHIHLQCFPTLYRRCKSQVWIWINAKERVMSGYLVVQGNFSQNMFMSVSVFVWCTRVCVCVCVCVCV